MTDLTTTRARAWALVRGDGATMGFTDHDRDLAFDGITFHAGTGMSASAIVQATGLAVDNTEAAGALSDAGLTEADILAGRYDGAALTIWEVDWTDITWRRVLFRGSLGEISRAGGAFRAELRGLSEPLSNSGGRVFGNLCPAILGDVDCAFDLSQPGFGTHVTLLGVDQQGAVLSVAPFPEFADGWFVDGQIEFTSGTADGLSALVRHESRADGQRHLHLWAAPGAWPNIGDSAVLTAGCDKRFETCRLKFLNQQNFRGFPHVPSDDWLLATPRADEASNGVSSGGSSV